MAHFRNLLHATDPYIDFPVADHPPDLQGWSEDVIFAQLIQFLHPRLVIEIGTWKGLSAITMAKAMRQHNIDGEIVCVDTWLGSAEHVVLDSEWRASLRIKWGYPSLYHTFMSNVMAEGVSDIITPFPNTSEVAFYVFRKLKVRADLIYVDASHEFPSVLRDILAAWQLLADDGVLLGDDYHWAEVREAARVALGQLTANNKNKVFFYAANTKYILSKRTLPLGVHEMLGGRRPPVG